MNRCCAPIWRAEAIAEKTARVLYKRHWLPERRHRKIITVTAGATEAAVSPHQRLVRPRPMNK